VKPSAVTVDKERHGGVEIFRRKSDVPDPNLER
jgi:hypothetical protein